MKRLIPLVVLLTACSSSYRLMQPRPETSFPKQPGQAARYEAHVAEWSREERLGLNGSATVVLEDPALGADYLAYEAERQKLGPVRKDSYFTGLWDALYGPKGDRVPFRFAWSFDKNFHPQKVINPRSAWTFRLHDDRGRSWDPLFIGPVTDHSTVSKWQGSFRVWFPLQDLDKGWTIDGMTRYLRLAVKSPSGDAEFLWKFKPDL